MRLWNNHRTSLACGFLIYKMRMVDLKKKTTLPIAIGDVESEVFLPFYSWGTRTPMPSSEVGRGLPSLKVRRPRQSALGVPSPTGGSHRCGSTLQKG